MGGNWLVLILSLPTENATVRMRAWRSLKAAGAAVLRDGVYLLPERADSHTAFERIAADVQAATGTAIHTRLIQPEGSNFSELFDRHSDYASLDLAISQLHSQLDATKAIEQLRLVRKLRKQFQSLAVIDFFPAAANSQTQRILVNLEQAINRLLSPNEPQFMPGDIPQLKREDYLGKRWATRRRPWVDRLASAWLIARFIDPQAQFLWLDNPADCPADALSFDFDGANFTHVGDCVTFEVLLSSFSLALPALNRIAALVHFLDVGGVQPPEAVGIETLLAGLRDSIHDDDQLIIAANAVFDGLLVSFNKTTH